MITKPTLRDNGHQTTPDRAENDNHGANKRHLQTLSTKEEQTNSQAKVGP
jgi:hypothetical protein